MKLDDEQFDRLVRAVTKISHGHDEPHGIESLVMALCLGVDGRKSLAEQIYGGLAEVTSSIDNLADAIRGGPRLG